MDSRNSWSALGHSRDATAVTLVESSDTDSKPERNYHHRASFRYQRSIDGRLSDSESIPLTTLSTSGPDVAEAEDTVTATTNTGRRGRSCYKLPRPFLWLFFNGLVSFLWGIALAVFCAGKVPWTWNLSQFLKRYDREWTNEIAALVGSVCKLHVTYVLQQALELYSHIIVAREFTLKDLKWMQGVNEETIFAKFPDRPGAPPRSEEPQGLWGRVKRCWWSVFRFCSMLRLSWIVIWLGLLLHNTAIVSILQPDAALLTLDPERFLSGEQQQVLDKMSFEMGIQLGNYVDQVSGNTTTAVAGRNYRKDNFAYGAIGGLIEGLQDIPGVQFTAQCTSSIMDANTTWSSSLAGVTSPSISQHYDEFSNLPVIPNTYRSLTSHSTLSFNITLLESAMYAVVDPQGNGAFLSLSKGASNEPPAPLICGWTTEPKLLHIEMVNFTALVLGHEPSNVYPSLVGRSTLATVTGMVQASRLGASINLDTIMHLRHDVTAESGPSYWLRTNATTAQIVETILADGGKASMTKYNTFLNRRIPRCNSKNKTVATHWKFGNNKKIGWIAVIWTIGMGLLGMVTAVWMSRKERLDGVSPLGAAGGFVLALGENIPDDQPLVVRGGKGGYARDDDEQSIL
ncbi:hypothetical protein NMY22_g8435 [Coprinellus aureogranulatus]|nr:hypothetical protein NMY22_g8435 [Coprinellus aureogranulatus]